ncbi:MAG: fluoride efflux transporter CrcB [Cyclobacteriaceae bacterium]|nr:fluoride efflux transporter CrcB [Cyclobacteriaceae bacterium]
MLKILLLLAGGALGTLARYALSGFVQMRTGSLFPWGTLSVNLMGCFLVGLLWGFFEESSWAPHWRTFVFIGIFGGFTTFSTYALESVNLLRDGAWRMAILSMVLNNAGGILLAYAGMVVARYLVHVIR